MTQAARYLIPGWCLGRGPLQPLAHAIGASFIDLPGYGVTAACADFEQSAERIAAALPSGASLAGWSLGAQLALAVAARAPDKVGRLVLIAGTASFVQRDGWPDAMPPATLATFSDSVATDAEAVLPRFVGNFNRGDAGGRAVTRQLLEMADPRPPAGVLLDGLHWLADIDLRPQLDAIRAPTLLIHGEHDPLMPLSAAHALAAGLDIAQVCVIEGTAHAPFITRLDEVAGAINGFLADGA